MSDYYVSGYNANSAKTLVTAERVPELDMDALIGQRQATWRFDLTNGVSGENLGRLYPLMDNGPAVLTHDAGRTIKRDLRLELDPSDAAEINTLTDRVSPSMIVGGRTWPLGRYQFTGSLSRISTGGDDKSVTLMDEMFAVDQQLTQGFSSGLRADLAIRQLLDTMARPPTDVKIEPSPYPSAGSWRPGTQRGQAAGTIALLGDYETAWFDNAGAFRMVRTVDPAASLPAFDWDSGFPVYTDSITKSDNLLDAPNRFVVIGNGQSSQVAEVVGIYDIPPSAPHSIAQRGFIQQATFDMNVDNSAQATAVARALGMNQTIVEQVDASTPPDPRHDSYDVIRFMGVNWVETYWSMEMIEGGDMSHTLRRGYVVV